MSSANSEPDYAGDIECSDAWALLEAHAGAQIIDVRTEAEWMFVGLPDLSSLGRRVLTVEWQSYPSMTVNPNFVRETTAHLSARGATHDTPVLFLCRSGQRSRAAAIELTKAGFKKAYNIASGFEGIADDESHRGLRNGWKAAGLPWRQT